jgi:hypothetical protein
MPQRKNPRRITKMFVGRSFRICVTIAKSVLQRLKPH